MRTRQPEARSARLTGMAELTGKARKRLKLSDFAEKSGRKYPIEDVEHARNALSRVSANGTSAEKATVRRAVASKFPAVGKS